MRRAHRKAAKKPRRHHKKFISFLRALRFYASMPA